jgi:hypothetical protein
MTQEGELISLRVSFSGTPAPEVTWLKNGEVNFFFI